MAFRLILTQQGLANIKPRSFILNQPLTSGGQDYQANDTDIGVGGSDFEVIDLTEQIDEANAIGVLGNPVFSNLILTSQDGSLSLRIDTVLITVSMVKNIVKTKVSGRNGTFKEYISDGDYRVDIRGVLVSPNSQVYPRDDIQTLKDLAELPEGVQASSDFLNLFGVKNLVIEQFTFPQNENDGYNTQPFTIKALSDEPLELLI